MTTTQERLTAVRGRFAEWKIDGLLITSNNNYRWLSGFTGSNCTLLITADQALLGTDFRYWEQAEQQSPEFELVRMGSDEGLATFTDMVKMSGSSALGLEGSQVSIVQYKTWQKATAEIEGLKLISLGQTVEPLRLIKTDAELDKIRAAAAITDEVMGQVNTIAKVGMTEKALAWELEKRMRELGADGLAFDIIVAAGPNGALAHHRPSSRPLQQGDTIVIDMGAKLDGYHSDLTRSFHMGEADPDDKFWAVYNLVLAAQKNALAEMRANMSGQAIDALARDVIDDAGHGEAFGHSLGHGVGLEIHENPRLSKLTKSEIPAGSVVTVEPGVYLPGWGGIRIEDLVVLGTDGVEFLSHCPKNPIIPISN